MGECFIARRGGGKAGLKSISVTTPPNKTDYVVGESFDPSGMVVMADLGGISIEASGYTVTPTTMALNTTEVTITYELAGVTQSCTQAIAIKTLSSIAITTQPTKTAYTYGETFSPAGMVITATYSDGSTAVVSGWTYAPTGTLNHGSTTVTVSYSAGGTTKTTTTTITIAKILTAISITTAPSVTTYIAGQAFSSDGMVVKATYSDGSTATVTSSCSFSPTTMAASTTEVTVSYTYVGITKTANQNVTVITPSTTLENNSWETIGLVADAGMASNFWSVGNEKAISLNGTNYTVQIVGFNHDNLAPSDPRYGTSYNGGTNKAALTFALKECFTTSYRMNSSNTNSGGWDATEMRTSTLAVTFYGYLETALKNALRTVNKLAAQSGDSSTILTSADKLFLFSEIEVFGNSSTSKSGEGSQYGYWSAGNSKIKYLSGSAKWWWLRSPYSDNTVRFLGVYSGGGISYHDANYSSGGVAFGFCV